jgi:hypothetical protein
MKEGTAQRAWRYVRELRFIDPNDRTALRGWYHDYHKYIWGGFFAVSAIDLLAAPAGIARIASAALTLAAGLLWIFA